MKRETVVFTFGMNNFCFKVKLTLECIFESVVGFIENFIFKLDNLVGIFVRDAQSTYRYCHS